MAKRGQLRKVRNPKMMWDLFQEYVEFTKSRPIKKMDFKGKDADMVHYELERPLSMMGFNSWTWVEKKLITDIEDYFTNTNGDYDEFKQICAKIKATIKGDQIEGGMAKIYDPGLTSRLVGLTDKQEHTVKAEQPLFKLDD